MHYSLLNLCSSKRSIKCLKFVNFTTYSMRSEEEFKLFLHVENILLERTPEGENTCTALRTRQVSVGANNYCLYTIGVVRINTVTLRKGAVGDNTLPSWV